MDKDRLREVARKGGHSVASENRSFSKDRQHASRAGKLGGRAKGRKFMGEAT